MTVLGFCGRHCEAKQSTSLHEERMDCSAVAAYFFWQMPDDAGHEISGRKAVEISSRKGAAKAATKAASEGTEDARDQRLG